MSKKLLSVIIVLAALLLITVVFCVFIVVFKGNGTTVKETVQMPVGSITETITETTTATETTQAKITEAAETTTAVDTVQPSGYFNSARYCYALRDNVLIKAGPGSQYETIGVMTENEIFDVIGYCSSDVWIYGNNNKVYGWVIDNELSYPVFPKGEEK